MLKLKRVEIQGFKSFYDRTEMKFTGSGITAVVGPNGCGKSNLSDAISWVLGEQSAKTLRGARMEDVIFAGTGAKKPLGMASVTLTLIPDAAVLSVASLPVVTAEVAVEPQEIESAHLESLHLEQANGLNGHSPNGLNGKNGLGHASEAADHQPFKSGASKTAEGTGEVTITRRLYRSGESEYLINGKSGRLRDIQDLFLGTGLGPESYAIIEQGRIGQILSNKPQDRRNLIEEAAGVTKFKTRKRLAEAKLESAKQNLSRVFDILEEVTRQVNSLKRQAAKTKRYSELKGEATTYLRQVLAAKFRTLERESAKVTIELNLASTEWQTLQESVGAREIDQKAGIDTSYAVEQELTQTRKELADLRLEAERAKGLRESQAKQVQKIEERLGSIAREMQGLDGQRGERAADLAKQTGELDALQAEVAGTREQLDAKTVERGLAQNRLSEQERGLEASRQAVLRLLGESSGLKNRVTQIEGQIASADRDAARMRAEEQQWQEDLARIGKVKAQLSERLSARQMELISVTDQRKAVDQELGEKRSKLSETRQTLDRLRSEFSRVKARKDSLEGIIQHRSYTTETVKRLFTAVEKGKAEGLKPVGVLADFLEVDPQLEKATEEFLHDELEYVVVRDWTEAERGIEVMRSELEGRATFLAEADPSESDAALEASHAPAEEPQTEPGKLAKLTDWLRFTNGLSNARATGLPRIANCYVTPDRALARELAGSFPHCWFLTPDGLSYHGHAVSGGKKTSAGPLALKRELREVLQLEASKGKELDAAQTGLVELERRMATLNEQLESLRGKQQTQEKDVLALDHESRKLAEEFARIQSRLSRASLDLDRLSNEHSKLVDGAAQDRAKLAQVETARAAQERELENAREELGGLRAEAARCSEEHAIVRAHLASLEERLRSATSQKTRLESQLRDLVNRRDNLGAEAERSTAERAQFLGSNAQLEAKLAELDGALSKTDVRVTELAEREAALRGQLAATEEELKRLRAQVHGLGERRSELQIALVRAESEIKHLDELSQKELETPLRQLAEGFEVECETVPDEAALRELDAKYNDVRRKIEALGPVNAQALEEYEESQARQDFLSAQRQDLLDSIRDTETAIHEIDGESRKRFGEAFHAINANFREMFKTLFSGGVGEMRLTDEENLSDSGIDIVASPPGKRLQSVLLLSGGEKSLTAMALLMAIFQYTPSPFCILDEVDAPLDEPNIQRLTKLLGDMAEQTQFIVITHSKRTMEAAQSLYGVTMQEPGVSRLVSVKLSGKGQLRPGKAEAEPNEEQQFAVATA